MPRGQRISCAAASRSGASRRTQLREWATEVASLPDWLFAECYDAVGDLGETIALLLPSPTANASIGLAEWVETQLLPMKTWSIEERKAAVLKAWSTLGTSERLIVNKLMTGEFRVGVSQLLVVRAIAKWSDVPANIIAHRLMGDWIPTPEFFTLLTAVEPTASDVSRPYPFSWPIPSIRVPRLSATRGNGRLSGSGMASVPN